MKFKPGDKVIRTGDSGYYIEKGKTYTVKGYENNDPNKLILEGVNLRWWEFRFELAPQQDIVTKFKVDDYVTKDKWTMAPLIDIVTKIDSIGYYTKGSRYIDLKDADLRLATQEEISQVYPFPITNYETYY
jgi:hypothetical protein